MFAEDDEILWFTGSGLQSVSLERLVSNDLVTLNRPQKPKQVFFLVVVVIGTKFKFSVRLSW